jgi:hypothetical protein
VHVRVVDQLAGVLDGAALAPERLVGLAALVPVPPLRVGEVEDVGEGRALVGVVDDDDADQAFFSRPLDKRERAVLVTRPSGDDDDALACPGALDFAESVERPVGPSPE